MKLCLLFVLCTNERKPQIPLKCSKPINNLYTIFVELVTVYRNFDGRKKVECWKMWKDGKKWRIWWLNNWIKWPLLTLFIYSKAPFILGLHPLDIAPFNLNCITSLCTHLCRGIPFERHIFNFYVNFHSFGKYFQQPYHFQHEWVFEKISCT